MGLAEELGGPGDPVTRGSRRHANDVFEMARVFFSGLSKYNMFRPTCLAKISHNDRSFIGASMAVGHFLQPICLFNRIINLKESLGAAIINYRPMSIPDEWEFEAFTKPEGERWYSSSSNKRPCQNCKMMFRRDRTGRGESTILGLCAEYCAINQLLPEEQTLKQSDMPGVFKLVRNYNQCRLLFENYRVISNECMAVDINNTTETVKKYWEVIYKLHIFGLTPECNRYF